MRDNTYIKLFRRIEDWEWYSDANTMRVFIHILLKANIKPKRYKGVEIKPGQCVFGRKVWANELGLTERQVRTAINHLKSTNEVSTEATNKFTVITVENWDLWQVCEGKTTNETTNNESNKSQTKVKQTTTPKECKNVRNKEYKEKEINKEKERFKKPTLEELKQYIQEKNLNVDAERFYDYYESNGWKVGRNSMKDWKATLRGWSKRENDDRGNTTRSRNNENQYGLHSGAHNRADCREDSKADEIQRRIEAVEKAFAKPNPFID